MKGIMTAPPREQKLMMVTKRTPYPMLVPRGTLRCAGSLITGVLGVVSSDELSRDVIKDRISN